MTSTVTTQTLPRLNMNIRFMMALYTILPLTSLIVLADAFAFNHRLRDALPMDPHTLTWFALIFNFPHIMASHIAFADKEYLQFYKKRLWQAYLASIALCVVLPTLIGGQLFLVVAATFSVYHVIRQQFGITLMLLGIKPTRMFITWRALAIVGGSILYFAMFGKYFVWHGSKAFQFVGVALTLLSCIFGCIALAQTKKDASSRPLSRAYMGLNIAMMFLIAVLFGAGYSFFGLLVPRFIHDVTAMAIYAVHDQNRNAATSKNTIYALTRWMRLSPLVLCAPLGVLLAFVLSGAGTGSQIGFVMIGIFSFAHYILEGYVWKSGSLHRREVAFITG